MGFTRSLIDSVLENVGRVAGRVQERRPLDADILESDDAYLVVVDAPGAQPEDIDVRYLDGRVQVNVERFREYREGFSMRFPGRGLSLRGSIALPEATDVDPATASATLDPSGTLQITIPKRGTDPDDAEE